MSVNLQFAKLERCIYGPYSPGTRMRNGIFRVYVHSNAGDIISRDGLILRMLIISILKNARFSGKGRQ